MAGKAIGLESRVFALLQGLEWDPTPIQRESEGVLLSGKDALLVAPTGSGKTEAAVIPLVSRALDQEWEPLSILYITPLRALNRDMDQRLGPFLEPLGLDVGGFWGPFLSSQFD